MGAGRSGTTFISTILGGAEGITTLGEMHQLLDYVLEDEPCSCGETLDNCVFWKDIRESLLESFTREELVQINAHNQKVESHLRIPLSWMKKDKPYVEFQDRLFKIISEKKPSTYYLDAAKFISRALQLRKTSGLDVKLIYVIRDVRGVIHSFNKKVQTSKSPLGTLIYYHLINFFGQNLAWTIGRKGVLKIRYEDMTTKPEETLRKIQEFTGQDLSKVSEMIRDGKEFPMPHIIGGNRMKSNRSIRLNKDFAWKSAMSRTKQVIYYLCALPPMIFNKYRI